MTTFRFRLATLLRLRESTRDERRLELARAYQADDLLRREEQRVEDELAGLTRLVRHAAGPGPVNVDGLLEAQRFEIVLKAQRQHLARQREMVGAEIERRRQALVEANRDVQVLERLRQRQADRHRDEENRRDILRIDEVAQRRTAGEEVE
ncbi:MAG: flagellar export protein FliJ [Thermoguttaceae bacterium]|jgi:flagellar FliJ protein|nr:flagellar export protein FliJ [Thermoguttaceae bacterium]